MKSLLLISITLLLFGVTQSVSGDSFLETSEHTQPHFTVATDSDSGKILSPLKQLKSGIQSSDVQCPSYLSLVMREKDEALLCLKTQTISKLAQKLALHLYARDSQAPEITLSQMKDSYEIGEKIDFTINYKGDSYACTIPDIFVADSSGRIVWTSNYIVRLCDPDDKPSYKELRWNLNESHLGNPTINKDAGSYRLLIKINGKVLTKDFWVNPQTSIVKIISNEPNKKSYSPQDITVKIGVNNTVRWENQDNTINEIMADNPTDLTFYEITNLKQFSDRNVLAPGQSFDFSFDKEGTFGYHGKPWQRGTVTVLPSDPLTIQLQIQSPDTPDDKDYSLKVAARKGFFVQWRNIDAKTHTITSKSDNGKTFDSEPIPYHHSFTLDTAQMSPGYYRYFDRLHPELSDTIRIIDPAEFDDQNLIEITKKLKEVKKMLEKYPDAISYVEHDYFDSVVYDVRKKIGDDWISMRLFVIFDESGKPSRNLISCGYGGVSMDLMDKVYEYLTSETCIDKK